MTQSCSNTVFMSYQILFNTDKTPHSPQINGLYMCETDMSDTHGNG